MKFSVYLPRPGEYADEQPETLAELAQAIEAAGFDACSMSDHPFPVVAGRGHQAHDPFVGLAAAAAATTRLLLHLGLVVASYRSPFVVARSAATLQYLSRGRVVLGLGAGYMQEEFAALGADFAARRAFTAASIEAIRLAFTGEPVQTRSEWWQADGNSLAPAPDPPLPLWLGGNSRWAIEQAVTSCDGWSPHEVTEDAGRRLGTVSVASLEDLRGRMAILRELIEQHRPGEPFDVCFVRGHAGSWRPRANDAILEELYAFRDLGVTWMVLRLEATTTPELVDEIRWFGELAAPLRVPSAERCA